MNRSEGQAETIRGDIREFVKTLAWILSYLRRRFIYLIIAGVLGASVAGIFLFLTPKQYVTTINFFEISPVITSSRGDNFLSHDIKSSIERLKLPSSYTQSQIEACGLGGYENSAVILSKHIKIRNITNKLFEVTVTGNSSKKSETCASSLVDLINAFESKNIAVTIEKVKAQLASTEEALNKYQNILSSNQKFAMNTQATQSILVQINSLVYKISHLKDIIYINSLTAPFSAAIFVDPTPVYPQKSIALVLGLFLGFMMAFIRDIILYCLVAPS